MNVLVTIPVREKHKKRLEAAAPGAVFTYTSPSGVPETQLKETDVILGNLDPPGLVTGARKLKLIQLNSAGTEGYCKTGVLPEQAVLTNATGAYGKAISEYMVGAVYMLRKKLNQYYKNQLQAVWEPRGEVEAVEGSTVLIIGLGDIGCSFARKMKALGCTVIGMKRRPGEKPDCVDELYLIEELETVLPRAEIAALCLPGNADTYRLLNRRTIGLLPENALVLNVGRGTCIETDALCEALQSGRIRGAYLDVTDPEPLPDKHPLWQMDQVIITPHITGGYWLPETLERIVDIMEENLKRLVTGQDLLNRVDPEKGYRI